MKRIMFLVLMLVLIPSVAFALPNMTARWMTPQGIQVVILQNSKGQVITNMTMEYPNAGLVSLNFRGQIKLLPTGKVGIDGSTNDKFPVMSGEKKCMIENLQYFVIGDVVGQRPGRKFHAQKMKAGITGMMMCPGYGPDTVWIPLSGVWK